LKEKEEAVDGEEESVTEEGRLVAYGCEGERAGGQGAAARAVELWHFLCGGCGEVWGSAVVELDKGKLVGYVEVGCMKVGSIGVEHSREVTEGEFAG
jgi:hypothetical protein